MAKLSVLKSAVLPTKRTGAKKNLLKKDGISSDGINDHDDDSSSLSERQEKKKTGSIKKFQLKFLRRTSARKGADDDGYESDANASTGSTRSTSSSFLRYQNRAIWRTKLSKKSVLQRCGDGSETPLKDATKPWPLFERIYKTQNQLLKKGEHGEEEEVEYDDDSVSSADLVDSKAADCPSDPPSPIAPIGIEEEVGLCLPEDEGRLEFSSEKERPPKGKRRQSCGKGALPEKRSEECKEVKIPPQEHGDSQEASAKVPDKSKHDVPCSAAAPDKTSRRNTPKSASSGSLPSAVRESDIQIVVHKETTDPPESADRSSPRTVGEEPPKSVIAQESNLPTSETSFATPSSPPKNDASKDQSALPIQKLTQTATPGTTSKDMKSAGVKAKSSRKSRKKRVSDEEHVEIVPLSVPRTICYSLRSAIGDGSARQRNSHSLMERRPLRPNGCHLDTSYWSHRGKRNYMEDRFVIEHLGKNSDSKPISLFAIFDGHGGSLSSHFCSDWMSSYIRKKNKHFPESLGLAMKTAFLKVDTDFVRSGHFDGSTACACAVVGNKVICCNSGDSRAIIVRRDGTAVALSEDHKPELLRETKRINALGGRVIHWGRWRVEGVLAVSRSIGDARLKPYVTAEPDITEHELGKDDMFLVVASDGVWDTMSNDLVAKFVIVNTCKIVDKSLNIDNKLLHWIARQVSKRARENGSSDNISVIVARLNGN